MAVKVFILLALFAAVYAADIDCKCDPPNETENSALWDFLKKLSDQEPEDLEDHERLDAVLPAVLSPLFECNCLQDKTRRKRRIMPDVTEKPVTSEEAIISEEAIMSEESLAKRRDPKCPRGHIWFGIMCVNERYLLDK